MDGPFEGQNGKNILGTFKKCITTHNIPTTLQIDNWTEFENNIMNKFWLAKNIQHIFGTPYILKHLGFAEVLTGQFKIF